MGIALGEGQQVRLVAFIVHAKYSNDTSGGETVNCSKNKQENNDIHIALGRKATTEDCATVTAEIIPHYRPTLWELQSLDRLPHRPVRITGQLFFDASHAPCAGGARGARDPARISLWEIHPVYTIDVCKNKTLAGCKTDNPAVWNSFDKWIKNRN